MINKDDYKITKVYNISNDYTCIEESKLLINDKGNYYMWIIEDEVLGYIRPENIIVKTYQKVDYGIIDIFKFTDYGLILHYLNKSKEYHNYKEWPYNQRKLCKLLFKNIENLIKELEL